VKAVVTRSKDQIVDAICEQLLQHRPLARRKDAAIANEVRLRLELYVGRICKLMSGVTKAGAINKAARQLRVLLEETFPAMFEELNDQLKWFEKIKGPDTRSEPLKWLDAEIARTLIKDFSQTRPTINPEGPLRMIASLIHVYRTGKKDQDLERSCRAVLKASG
jgi:hypothetical protein